MSSNKPVVILVHGAWHRPSHWRSVTAKLQAHGYRFETPALLSATTTPVEDPLAKDIALIKETIRRHTDAGANVVIAMHSYAGLCGSEAIAEYYQESQTSPQAPNRGRILHLFYIAGMILDPGTSSVSDGNTPHVVDMEDNLLYHLEPYLRFYNTTPPKIARQAMAELVPHALLAFTTNTKHRGYADCGVPVTYLACKRDQALLYETDTLRFVGRLEKARIDDLSVRTIDCDHTPWLSAEEEFYAVLWEVLDKAGKQPRSKV